MNKRVLIDLFWLFLFVLMVSLLSKFILLAFPHDIYTGIRGKDQQLCCGGDDCFLTEYRIHKGHYLFLTKENNYVDIPEELITFLPVPGEKLEKVNAAHLCYRGLNSTDVGIKVIVGKEQSIYLYCAFIPPGGV